jgi:LysM repeat protein
MNNLIQTIKKVLIGVEIVLLIALGSLSWRAYSARALQENDSIPEVDKADVLPTLPSAVSQTYGTGITRQVVLKTNIPSDRPNTKVVKYTVEKGDSAWSISAKFNLRPESILWANDGLSAEANSLKIGDTLNIPPVDGVLHTVQEGDTLENISLAHGIPIDEIVAFTGNEFDLTKPSLKIGQQVVVPNGSSPIVWNDPEPVSVAGGTTYGGNSISLVNLGTGYFIWPVGGTILLNQEYWAGHPALDINTYYRQPVFASDSGTVVFSDWSTSGYGNLVIIDHGNGYRTYYAHNEANLVSVGQGVVQGQQIAESGNTGNSTGNHLDFRIRATGGAFYNPLDFLP